MNHMKPIKPRNWAFDDIEATRHARRYHYARAQCRVALGAALVLVATGTNPLVALHQTRQSRAKASRPRLTHAELADLL